MASETPHVMLSSALIRILGTVYNLIDFVPEMIRIAYMEL